LLWLPYFVFLPRLLLLLLLLQLVKEVVNPDAEIVYRENTADDPSRRRPDISKMQAKYGWEPRVPLQEGLALMVDDFKKRLHVE
jgi:UDP-glucuronate decarboxylase